VAAAPTSTSIISYGQSQPAALVGQEVISSSNANLNVSMVKNQKKGGAITNSLVPNNN
jgi:hypothetical protein